MLVWILLVAACPLLVLSADVYEIIADTPLGKIGGSKLKTLYDKEILAFRGIRYAEAPIGPRRFAPATPVKPWPDTYNASVDRNICPQPDLYGIGYANMHEDCLFLSVYTQDLKGNFSVLVHIHGGGNYVGSSNSSDLGPQYLLDKNIVLVTLNYRLGALGFLVSGTMDSPGNNGYKDQVVALKWVKENIAAFGGNPNSVTISGQSAGGMAVTLQLVSPMSKGLFNRAIPMSGSTTSHYFVDNLKWTRQLAHTLACPMYNGSAIVECLRQRTWESIILVCSTWEPYGLTNMKWEFEIEKDFGQERFLTDHPTELFRKGDFHKVPILTGISKNEFEQDVRHIPLMTGLLSDVNANWDKYAPEFLTFDPNLEDAQKISQELHDFYVGEGKNISADNITETFGQMFSDAIISHGVHRLVDLARKHTNVYYYRFDYLGQYSRIKDANGKSYAVVHVDELQYLFVYNSVGQQFKKTDPEIPIVNAMIDWWSSFVINGVPDSTNNTAWYPSNSSHVSTLYIDKEIEMGEEPYQDRYKVWDRLFPVSRNGSHKTAMHSLLLFVAMVFTYHITN